MGIFKKKLSKSSVGIQIDKRDRKMLNKKNSELLHLLREQMLDTGYFETEGIDFIINKIGKTDFYVVHPSSIKSKIIYEPFLSLDDKKNYGINYRLKVGQDFFNSLSQTGKKLSNPYGQFTIIYHFAHSKIGNKYTLERYRESGVSKAEIKGIDDTRACNRIKTYNKVWSIDEVPELPLIDCDADICRCCYSPVL